MFLYTPVLEFTFGVVFFFVLFFVCPSNDSLQLKKVKLTLFCCLRVLIPVISLNCEEAKEKNGSGV